MYIQLTTRCNMRCAHCAFSCTARGEDMTKKTFLAALNLAYQYGESVTLGGEEPTVHRQFWEFLGLALSKVDDEPGIFLVTNGKITETAIALAGLARRGVLGVALSQDDYHDRIDPAVIRAFMPPPRTHDQFLNRDYTDRREIRRVTEVLNAGRAARNGLGDDFERCSCDDLLVTPRGLLWACACREQAFGTVIKPTIPDRYWASNRCWSRRSALAATA